MYYIYIYKNIINNKIYIGKTNNLKRREIEHLAKSRKDNNQYFYNAIRKYGIDNFSREIIFECENENEAYKMEEYYINLLNSNNNLIGYNSTAGGEGLNNVSDETRKKMSESAKLRVGDKNGFYGFHHSEETKKIISSANSGNKYHLGKCHSNESKQNISKSKKGKRSSISTEFKAGQLPLNAKITMEQAKEIRLKFKNGTSRKDLMLEYNLSKFSISNILLNRSYKDK